MADLVSDGADVYKALTVYTDSECDQCEGYCGNATAGYYDVEQEDYYFEHHDYNEDGVDYGEWIEAHQRNHPNEILIFAK